MGKRDKKTGKGRLDKVRNRLTLSWLYPVAS